MQNYLNSSAKYLAVFFLLLTFLAGAQDDKALLREALRLYNDAAQVSYSYVSSVTGGLVVRQERRGVGEHPQVKIEYYRLNDSKIPSSIEIRNNGDFWFLMPTEKVSIKLLHWHDPMPEIGGALLLDNAGVVVSSNASEFEGERFVEIRLRLNEKLRVELQRKNVRPDILCYGRILSGVPNYSLGEYPTELCYLLCEGNGLLRRIVSYDGDGKKNMIFDMVGLSFSCDGDISVPKDYKEVSVGSSSEFAQAMRAAYMSKKSRKK